MFSSSSGLQSIIFWTGVVIALAASGLLTYSLLRFQEQGKPDLQLRNSKLVEIIWAILPLIFLVALLIFTFQALRG